MFGSSTFGIPMAGWPGVPVFGRNRDLGFGYRDTYDDGELFDHPYFRYPTRRPTLRGQRAREQQQPLWLNRQPYDDSSDEEPVSYRYHSPERDYYNNKLRHSRPPHPLGMRPSRNHSGYNRPVQHANRQTHGMRGDRRNYGAYNYDEYDEKPQRYRHSAQEYNREPARPKNAAKYHSPSPTQEKQEEAGLGLRRQKDTEDSMNQPRANVQRSSQVTLRHGISMTESAMMKKPGEEGYVEDIPIASVIPGGVIKADEPGVLEPNDSNSVLA